MRGRKNIDAEILKRRTAFRAANNAADATPAQAWEARFRLIQTQFKGCVSDFDFKIMRERVRCCSCGERRMKCFVCERQTTEVAPPDQVAPPRLGIERPFADHRERFETNIDLVSMFLYLSERSFKGCRR
jgi:hypothetical protein